MNNANSFRLLKLPFPYQAALAICSDIDGSFFERFLNQHKFLNSSAQCILGEGLKLPISNSFWMYDNPSYENSAFSYFSFDNKTPSKYAPVVRELINAGILDVMHGYGNFSEEKEFNRQLADQAINELLKHNLQLLIWTNHGGEESAQNIGVHSSGKGDIPDNNSQFYHADLLVEYGIKFFWDCELSLTQIVGQERPLGKTELLAVSPVNFNLSSKIRRFIKNLLLLLPFKFSSLEVAKLNWKKNELFMPENLRDSQPIFRFVRFGSGRYDWSDDLPNILNDKVLKKLLAQNGKMIVYVHLGDLRGEYGELPLSPATAEKFRQLAELFRQKKLWIATTKQILMHSFVTRYLHYKVMEKGEKYVICIDGVMDNPVIKQIGVEDLQGLSFLVPGNKDVVIEFKKKQVHFDVARSQESESQILTIPIKKIEWPL